MLLDNEFLIDAQGVIYPMEVVQTRLAVSQPGTYSGIADALAKIVRLEGPRALFRGLTPTMIGILPYAGASFRGCLL